MFYKLGKHTIELLQTCTRQLPDEGAHEVPLK